MAYMQHYTVQKGTECSCDRKRAGAVYESNIHKPGACSYGISLSKKYIYGNEVGSLL